MAPLPGSRTGSEAEPVPGGEAPDLQGGQVLGQLLFELDRRQGRGVGHAVTLGQGTALRGALARFLLSFFAFSGVSVES